MADYTPRTLHLADYAPPSFLIDTIYLDVEFLPGETRVTARLDVRRNPLSQASDAPLELDGEALELLSVSVDGAVLAADRYTLSDHQLILNSLPDAFCLETVTRIHPDDNTCLSGLYRSANGYFTQCEA